MSNHFSVLLDIIEQLDNRGIHYVMSASQPRSVRIRAVSPRRFWEIDVFEEGTVDVEVYEATHIEGPEALQRLYALYDES